MSNTARTAVALELQQIAASNNGALRPKDVVEFAQDEDTALHNHFDWDDSSAAVKYRLIQARGIIRAQVTLIKHENRKIHVRAYHSLPKDRGYDSYRSTEAIMSKPKSRQELLQAALKELTSFQRKYKFLSELSDIFDAIDHVADVVNGHSEDEDPEPMLSSSYETMAQVAV